MFSSVILRQFADKATQKPVAMKQTNALHHWARFVGTDCINYFAVMLLHLPYSEYKFCSDFINIQVKGSVCTYSQFNRLNNYTV